MSVTTAAKAKVRAPYFDYTTDVEVDITIDPDELHKDGWHHKSECEQLPPAPAKPLVAAASPMADALASLHRQAHPSQPGDPVLCREEPCRSLSIAQLRGEAAVA